MKYRVRALIDLASVRANYNYIKSKAGSSRVCAVVKADAYGHGSAVIASELQKLGCKDYAVACLSEALVLKNAGINGNILILGPTDREESAEVVENGFIQAVDSFSYAQDLASHGIANVHIKVDTGMSRIGIYCHSEADVSSAADEIEKISKIKNVNIRGIFTHFADSDGDKRDFTDKQFSSFKALLDELEKRGVDVGTKHCCNSAATLRYPEMHLDMVRAGIILYGLMPSPAVSDGNLKPAMKLSARVCAVHELKKGDAVSYGCTYKAEKDTKVAVIALGYADGFSRVYSGKPFLKINGKRYSTVGKICMDMCMADIGEDNVQVGDEAVVFENSSDIDALASALGTINYEILCSLKHRVLLQYK